jgi:hypothetical protein
VCRVILIKQEPAGPVELSQIPTLNRDVQDV